VGWLAGCPGLAGASGLSAELVERWLAAEDALEAASQQFEVPLGLLTAVAYVESSWRPDSVSPAGALGLLQIMPGTWKFLTGKRALDWPGVDAFDPAVSAKVGAYYLRRLLRRWKGRPVDWAVASYYAGAGAVGQYGPSQFGGYVDRVLEARRAVELTYARCYGAPWAADGAPTWPGQRKPKGRGPEVRHDDEPQGSGGERAPHEPASKFGDGVTLGLGVLGLLVALRTRRERR
jgi:hypothetical protein